MFLGSLEKMLPVIFRVGQKSQHRGFQKVHILTYKNRFTIFEMGPSLMILVFLSRGLVAGELELPFSTMLVVIVAPHQSMNLRGTQDGTIISLVIAAYLGFQHFSRVGHLQKAFEQGSIVSTIAIICMTCIPCVLLF